MERHLQWARASCAISIAMLCNTAALAQTAANPLLAIDQHRATVVERIVGKWGDRLSLSDAGLNREQLREMLNGLRADQLLAASLAGSLTGLRDVLAHSLAAAMGSAPRLTQAKALGDSADDVVYTPVTPCRLVETRGTFAAVYQVGGAFSGGEVRNYTIQGGNGVCLTQLPASLNPSAVQLQVFGIPINSGSSGDIEILPQGSTFGSTATEVYVGNVAFNTVSTTAKINLANNQIGVQVRGGGANVAIDAVGYFKRPGNYGGTHTITGQYATDSGGYGNTSSNDYSVVGGGQNNTASGFASTVAGGGLNAAVGAAATVAGGNLNSASRDYSTVGGGVNNTASGGYSTVAGGEGNTASGVTFGSSTVSGGTNNTASGSGSTVPGGAGNLASADFSFAAGYRAKAREPSMFVWADGKVFDFDMTLYRSAGLSANTFNVRATAGVYFATGINLSTGAPTWACYAVNGAGWTCTSDRNVKRNLRPVDGEAMLAKVVAMPVYHWQPKDGPNREVEHLGPTAQDFMAAFGLGDNDKSIGFQDAEGVALAAIQGLNAKIGEQQREIAELRRMQLELRSMIEVKAAMH